MNLDHVVSVDSLREKLCDLKFCNHLLIVMVRKLYSGGVQVIDIEYKR